jgi:hypothetical protein
VTANPDITDADLDAPIDDEELLAASREVDITLLEWSLSLSWRERLRACTESTRALEKLKARRGG